MARTACGFSTSGAVQRGPANRPLRAYATRFADDILTISLQF